MNFTMSQSQLIALAEENHFSQLLEEIENIHRIDPAMAEKIAEIFNVSLSTQDDFEEIFDNTFVNILYFLWLNLLNVSLPYEVLLILYEKYGGDPMKRSLRNQLYAQTGWIGIFWCTVPLVIWAFRMFIGPLNSNVAVVYSFFQVQCLGQW